jgi:DNA-binding MarR family transcriptional regulator
MPTDLLTRQNLSAWIAYLRTHAAIKRQLNADLLESHGLTLSDYEVLLRLSQADGREMRRIDLAESVVLTASGITRLLDGLERAGYVEKGTCASDARVSYARLTEFGLDKLREAAVTHLAGVDELFTGRYTDEELETLGHLLARLPTTGRDDDGPSCSPPEADREDDGGSCSPPEAA